MKNAIKWALAVLLVVTSPVWGLPAIAGFIFFMVVVSIHEAINEIWP